MSDDRIPAPIEALVRAIAGGPHDDDDRRATTFARGLALGALVGAAIAGSTIWQRRHGAPAAVRPPAAPAMRNPATTAVDDDAGMGPGVPSAEEPSQPS